MRSLPLTSTSSCARSIRGLYFSPQGYRLYSSGVVASSGSVHSASRQRPGPPTYSRGLTFEQLGLTKSIVQALRDAYPDISRPTDTQVDFIPAILEGKDVLLKDITGSGKSFGLLLTLLSKRRRNIAVTNDDGPQIFQPGITSLLIVPHRDLAYQYLHWAERIHAHIPARKSFQSFAQVLARNAAHPIAQQLENVRVAPPHILIGTPQALCDALEQDEPALMLTRLSALAVDEADYLIESLPRTKDKYTLLKARKAMKRHPSPTRLLLDKIYAPYRPFYALQQTGDTPDVALKSDQTPGHPRPQLILSSATLRAHLRDFVIREGGWLTKQRGQLAQVTGPHLGDRASLENRAANTLGGIAVAHHALVVSADGTVSNISSVVSDGESNLADPGGDPIPSSGDVGANEALLTAQTLPVEGVSEPGRSLPFRMQTLEAVAEAFALDVPRAALLILPPSAPVVQTVEELRRLGINAEGLDIVREAAGRAFMAHERSDAFTDTPVLLVATLASMRGLDMPELTHAFILGIAQDSAVDAYLHAAGRVGRFGRGGKVISVLEERQVVMLANGAKVWRDEPRRMQRIFKQIGVRAGKFEHFA